MKSRADQGVVDARLNVYGVTNLKVADLSIVPKNVGTNTYSTALIIGDKAAMIIAEDLGIEYRLKVIVRNSSSASLMRILRVILNMHLA
ncbi:uncharacterized protein F5891DRAFT_340726 [Suillus fuscotomentosus]|uniref:Glucose-methanol-choline oxidoreductase C-terminal domain-containing protein n=1 Tax=Suillus fuscotomentosus TaxID=1912939 RepID=A0AAD4HKM8_9AGAM|nr:uncharacterized protein F5891DRAFT_340726 [Suillus fuscotomentosus]KAG1900103.1 hypothetical protein F5891DRAFT_340726 [Suillus fuscotomentosus]